MTYARARLWLGISGVGTAVLTATALLALDLPTRLLSDSASQPMAESLRSVMMVLGLGVLMFLPFDVIGGAVVVRQRPSVALFLTRWLRGVALQLVVWTLVAAVLMYVARQAAPAVVMAAFVGVQLVLALLRAPLARVIARVEAVALPERLRRLAAQAGVDPARLTLVQSSDEGFVGGWSGIAARTLVMPTRWLELPDDALLATLRRRQMIAASGAHRRGVLAAVAWNTLGFAAVLALTGATVATAAGLITVAAGMTLWAFLGVLVLPTPSRAAVVGSLLPMLAE